MAEGMVAEVETEPETPTVFERSSHVPFWKEPDAFDPAPDGFWSRLDR